MKSIFLRGLSYSYPQAGLQKDETERQILKDISIEIPAGRFLVILGESGCGKTTLLNLIAGLLIPSPEELTIEKKPITGPHPSRAYIFQTPRLLPWLNVKDNVAFGCRVRGDIFDLRNRVEELVDLVGLRDFAENYPANLSMGMAQRVAIARALIGRPDILLLDEPFTALDYYNRSHLQKELVRLWKQFGFTAVFVTHDIEEALALGEQIVILGNKPATVIRSYGLELEPPREIDTAYLTGLKLEIQQVLSEGHAERRRHHI